MSAGDGRLALGLGAAAGMVVAAVGALLLVAGVPAGWVVLLAGVLGEWALIIALGVMILGETVRPEWEEAGTVRAERCRDGRRRRHGGGLG
jgi:hypothetical protein